MAKGLINESTLTALANLIRENENTSEGILPADMEPRLRTIIEEMDKNNILVDFNIEGTGSISRYSLGVSLPAYDHYCFVVMPTCSSDYAGIKMKLGVIECDYCLTPSGVKIGQWNIDFENGEVYNQRFTPHAGASFMWAYFELKME